MSSKRSIDAPAEQMPVHADIVLPATGAFTPPSGPIEAVADPTTAAEKAALLAFMEEPLEVLIHESTDPNASPLVFLAVNGEGAGLHKLPWVPRGQQVSLKRKFVERLARAKPVAYQTKEVRDAEGARTTALVRHQALLFPFSVVHDPNPRGAAWLKRVLAQP